MKYFIEVNTARTIKKPIWRPLIHISGETIVLDSKEDAEKLLKEENRGSYARVSEFLEE